jgi:hypothetical protein
LPIYLLFTLNAHAQFTGHNSFYIIMNFV